MVEAPTIGAKIVPPHAITRTSSTAAYPSIASESGDGGDGSLGPCVDGSELARTFFTSQHWSVQPCVRPTSAVHMTAGHNALRGSGPGQKLAFDNAVAHMGCPDRRIDRLCITCCLPSQPSHHAGFPARSRSRCKRDWFLIALTSRHHRPCHSRDLVGKRNSSNLGRAPR